MSIPIKEERIIETIKKLNNFFGENPEREWCLVSLFDFDNVKIHANCIEQDIRNCAELVNQKT